MNTKETQLQQMLTHLRTRVLVMCATVGIAVDEACEALTTGNMGKASAVVDGDEAINALENEIDALALSLLVRHQPVAQDLRFVIAALRMVIDLERIGDEAVSIAERAVIMHEQLPDQVMEAVRELMDTARKSYGNAVDAFKEGDADQALGLCQQEDESTQAEVRALQRIMDYFCLGKGREDSGSHGSQYAGMHGILICRALNRICRRAANIAEHTYFVVRGVNIKHVPLDENGLPRN